MQLHTLLEMVADAEPDRVILTGKAEAVTLSELVRRSRAVAGEIENAGVPRVTFAGLNSEHFPALLFGASMAGVTFTPINYRLADSDFMRLHQRCAPAVSFADTDMIARIGESAELRLFDTSSVGQLYTQSPEDVAGSENEIAVILFTSGTTSEPKEALLRHQNLTSYVLSTVEFLGADASEAALVSVPPYHIAGISAVLTSVFCGRRIVYLPSFEPEAWVDAVSEQKITHAMVVPTMLGRVLDVAQQKNVSLSSLRVLSYGGGRMPLAVIERAMDLLPHVDFVNAYGLTETSSTIAVLDPETHRSSKASSDPVIRRRLGSVGKPLPDLELEIRDEAGARVPPGVSGEIFVRGDQVSGEYAGRKMIAADGWFATKDAGWVDKDGFLFVEGRLDDVIVRGGENISPGEIEDVIRTHPDVEDVAVLGLPDEQWGERVVAAVVARKPVSSSEIKALVRGRLRSTRAPETVFFRNSLPYNETGKLMRRFLKADLAEMQSTTVTE
ncbi:class I adenylate-forming enzyme family protein [Henriciella mobilis]|uniref:Long-chain fatty acid--CoA ligase n=1 Tax=Henriciella mobilis TaxID=2305467 RepID=A0A399R5D9_9PROT|nr:AMP-binding protein [Henriciella mobilis]RIJ26826.1 long-chain fatty acid--CoA ligase [Henriciella mobilis]